MSSTKLKYYMIVETLTWAVARGYTIYILYNTFPIKLLIIISIITTNIGVATGASSCCTK